MKKLYKSTYPEKYSLLVDEIVLQGGSWDELLEECRRHAIRLEKNPHTKSTLRAHIIWRIGEDSRYLGKYNMTDNGIELIS